MIFDSNIFNFVSVLFIKVLILLLSIIVDDGNLTNGTFNIKDYLETLTIEIKLKKNKKIIMSCLYNIPFNKTADLINMLYSKFNKYILHDLIIMGDFNIITNDPKPSQLNILINQLGLTPQILQNTRP